MTGRLLPANTSNGECPQCAVVHDPYEPHNQQSLFYQYSFYAENGRWPTWLDAMAHCDDEIREVWTRELHKRGVDI